MDLITKDLIFNFLKRISFLKIYYSLDKVVVVAYYNKYILKVENLSTKFLVKGATKL